MTQKTLENINRKIYNLKEEMKTLRSLVIGVVGKDQEGEYKPEFAKRVLKLSKKKGDFVFKNAGSFMEQIQKSK